MFNKIVATTRTQTASIILAFALAFISFSVLAPAASAQVRTSGVTAELQAQINALMAQIAALQGGSTTPVESPEVFAVGSEVKTAATVRVRAAASVTGVLLGTQLQDSRGKVVAGPIIASGYRWYQIDFINGVDGWVAGSWLNNASAVLVDVTTFVRTNNATGNQMTPGQKDASIVDINVAPASFDRYANKVVLRFTPAQANIENLPWVAFEKISLSANGWNIRNVNAGDLSMWRKVGTGYEITVFAGNQKISPNRQYSFLLSVTSDEDTPVGDRWNVTVPAKGAIIWSQTNGHMVNAAPMTTYPIEFIQNVDDATVAASVEIIDTEATTIANTPVNSESGEFRVKFEVTAVDHDIYLSGVPNGLDYFGRPFSEDSFVNFSIEKDGRFLDGYQLEGYTSTLTTTAQDVVSGPGTIHLINEGETEEFTFTVKHTPATGMAGAYRVQLEGPLRYSLDKAFNDDIPNKTTDIDEKASKTPVLYLIGAAKQTAKIDSFTVTPSTVKAGGGTPVTFTWKSTGTSFCYITENLNGVSNNLGLSDLKIQGTKTYYVPDKYAQGTVLPFVLSCQDASTQKDKLVQATTQVKLVAEVKFVTITNIATSSMPTISGNAEERVTTLGLSIAGPSGDKVYGSGSIPVIAGKWSHKVGTKLQNGIHEVIVYTDNKEVARKKFTVGVPAEPVKPTPRFNGLTYPVGTPNAAVSVVFTSPKTTSTGPVVLGYMKWGDAGNATQTVSAIPTGTQTTVALKHAYRTPGEYTITLIGLDGKVVTEKVKATFPVVSPKPTPVSSTTSSVGVVKGAATVDQLAEIQMTLANIQVILSELE